MWVWCRVGRVAPTHLALARSLRGARPSRRQGAPPELVERLGGDEFLGGRPALAKEHAVERRPAGARQQRPPERAGAGSGARPRPSVTGADQTTYRSYRQHIRRLKMELNPLAVTKENQHEKLRSAVEMLHDLPYDRQLEMKQRKNGEVVGVVGRASRGSQTVVRCREGPIIPSSLREQYRSKVSRVSSLHFILSSVLYCCQVL